MKIYFEKEEKTEEIEFEGTVLELLKKFKVNSQTVLVSKNHKLVELDEVLSDSDKIGILEVFMGG